MTNSSQGRFLQAAFVWTRKQIDPDQTTGVRRTSITTWPVGTGPT